MIIAAFATAIVFQLFTRFYLIARYRWVGSDTYYQLIVGEELGRRRTLRFIHNRFLVPEEFNYPPLVPIIVALAHRKWHQALQWLGPASDTLTVAIICFAVWSQFGAVAAAFSTLIYVTTPYTFDISYAFGPRPIGNLFFSISLVSVLFVDQFLIAVALASVSGVFVILSHRLTLQSWLVAFIGVTLVDPPLGITVIAVTLLIAKLIPGFDFVWSTAGHLDFIRALSRQPLTLQRIGRTIMMICEGNLHIAAFTIILGTSTDFTRVELICIAMILSIAALSLAWPFGEGDRHFSIASSVLAVFLGISPMNMIATNIALLSIIGGAIVILIKIGRYPKSARMGAGTIVDNQIRLAYDHIRQNWSNTRKPLILFVPPSLSYQGMYFADAQGFLGSGGTGRGLAFNKSLQESIRSQGLGAVLQYGTPDFIVSTVKAAHNVPDYGWHLVYSSDSSMVFAYDGPPSDQPVEPVTRSASPVATINGLGQ